MSKKDFEKAARIAQEFNDAVCMRTGKHAAVVQGFVELFRGEADGRFDEDRFRRACVPGNNVRAKS